MAIEGPAQLFINLKNRNLISRKIAELFLFAFFITAGGIYSANGANISIDDATVTETSGGVFINFDVNIDTVDPANDVTINYTVSDGTASDPSDYDGGGGSGSVTLTKFASTVQIRMATYDDSIYEGNETFTVTLTSVDNGHTISDATAIGTIVDNETTPVINITNPLTIPEGNTGNVAEITLSHAASVDIDVDYVFSNGTATNGVDFTGVDGTATVSALSTTAGIPATVTTDGIDEATFETFTVTVSNPSLGSLGSPTTETVSIVDVDGGLSVDDVTVSEADGNATVTVTLQGPTVAPVTVDYATADGTATAGVACQAADYTASSNTLTFAATGNTVTPSTQTFTIPIIDCSVAEASETFTVALSNVTGAAVLTDANATITITDDDTEISPSTQTVSGTVGSSITSTTAYTATNFTGTLSYAVSPALPSGLSLDTSTGVVSGTPSASQSATSYTITGTGSGSGSATATISITVSAAATPSLSPSTQTVSGTVGSSITSTTAYTATNFTGTLSYAVSPALPSGLSLDTSTGVVSGTPSASQSATSYTITGTGSGSGSATATISITVSTGNTISDKELAKAKTEVEVLWRSNDRLYNDRVTDQSRKILQLSLNDTLSGDCGTKGHVLCGATIEIANAARRIGKPDLVVKAGLPEIAVSGDDDGVDAKASFADVKRLFGDGSKRIVSVATEYVDHKGDTSTHSIMASVAREYFDQGKNATLGVMTHIYRAKTDVQGNYSGNATTEGINFGGYSNYFGNKNYVIGFYGSLGFSRTKYDLASTSANVINEFDAWNAQMGANVMGKRKFETVLYMPKVTLDTFLTKQKDSMPLVTAGSAVRHGFIASRVLSEIQLGFRPHFKIANIANPDEKITAENLTQELDFNPQIYCGYSANTSDCGLGVGITNKWKPEESNTEYRLGGDFSEYRGERKARLEFNIETEINGNPNIKTTTTLLNNNIAKTSGNQTKETGINWRFDYKF